jgi:tRNA/tmRNA/rRNA uracil-C5-methylase (TrmA/RlmC/RlmD family)
VLSIHDELELTIEKPAAGGWMIGRHEGQVVLVSGAIPGERVRVRVDRADRSLAYATTIEVLEAHAARRPVASDWTCGGNVYAFVDYEHQLQLKSDVIADAFARLGKITLDRRVGVHGSRGDGYRMRARLQVQAGRVGFFREGTHDLCDVGPTGQLLPETARVIDQISLRLRKIDPEGVVAVELAENVPAIERAVHLQLRPGPALRPTSFTPIAGIPGISGATYQRASGTPAVRLGGTTRVGDPYSLLIGVDAQPPFASARLEREARSFFQGNRHLLPRLIARVLEQLPPEGPVVDLYAGVGLFALSLAAKGRRDIVAVEGDRTSGADLQANARVFGNAVSVALQPVERFLETWRGDPAPALLLDPPRTGLSRRALELILAHGARRLVYVSCDVATLARDVGQAVARGYAITHMEAFDLFPNTAHVETVVVMER